MLLLHFSDIHFRADEVGSAMDHNQHLRNELVKDAKMICKEIGAIPDAILITGDIAYAGKKVEFDFASTWLSHLCAELGADYKNIIVIPGNHDADRSISSGELIQDLHNQIKSAQKGTLYGILKNSIDDTHKSKLLYESLSAYNEFAGQFLCDLLPPSRTMATREFYLNDGSKLRVSGLNSAFVSSRSDAKLSLFVDPSYNSLVKEPGVEHLVMCHHPYNWLGNGENLCAHLNDVARIHLFGHEHTSRIERNHNWLTVAAYATHPDRNEDNWQPGYNLMELEVEGTGYERFLKIKTHIRLLQQDPMVFVAKIDSNRKDFFEQSIQLDSWDKPIEKNGSQGAVEVAENSQMTSLEEVNMASLREVAINFSKLTLSQKSLIAGKLNLIEENDSNQPEFEKFRRILLRAKAQGLIEKLNEEIGLLK